MIDLEQNIDNALLRDLYAQGYQNNPTLEDVCKRFELALERIEDAESELQEAEDTIAGLEKDLSASEAKLEQALEDVARLKRRIADDEAKRLARTLDRIGAVII